MTQKPKLLLEERDGPDDPHWFRIELQVYRGIPTLVYTSPGTELRTFASEKAMDAAYQRARAVLEQPEQGTVTFEGWALVIARESTHPCQWPVRA
jgi:hypothetical protein